LTALLPLGYNIRALLYGQLARVWLTAAKTYNNLPGIRVGRAPAHKWRLAISARSGAAGRLPVIFLFPATVTRSRDLLTRIS